MFKSIAQGTIPLYKVEVLFSSFAVFAYTHYLAAHTHLQSNPLPLPNSPAEQTHALSGTHTHT